MENEDREIVSVSLSKEQQLANKMALRARGVTPHIKQYNLDFFCNAGEDKKIQPNDMARSALWSVQTTTTRDYVKNKPIYSSNATLNIFYTGEELQAATDEKVWMTLVHYSRKVDFGKKVTINISKICEENGWAKNGHYYAMIWASLERLHYAGLKVKKGKNKILAFIRMLNLHTVKGDNVLDTGTVEYSMDNESSGWYLLVAGRTTTLLDNKAITTLSPIAMRLYAWLSSHKAPLPLSIFDFHKLCASTASLETPQHLASWRRNIRTALKALIDGNHIVSGHIKNDVIFISR